jgi:hypothetical protein
MRVTLREGEWSVTLNSEQMHVLAELYEMYRSVREDVVGRTGVEVMLSGRKITVRAPKSFHAEFQRRNVT